jgi:hypothetical protein
MTEEQYEFENDYLTMARIMEKEWDEYQRTKVWGEGRTGLVELYLADAYQAGFMAGFSGRYFNTEEA